MRVDNNSNSGAIQGSETSSPRRTQKSKSVTSANETADAKSSKISADSGAASTEISSKAKEMARAKEVAMSAADVRESKIAELKKRIANKEYNVKPEDIADKLVDDHIKTRDLG